MYSATITSQGQITLPVAARKKVGFKPGDRVMVVPRSGRLDVMKVEGWESLRGVLSQFKGRYPTKKQLAEAWTAGYRQKWLKIG